jgi:hypothetical protein
MWRFYRQRRAALNAPELPARDLLPLAADTPFSALRLLSQSRSLNMQEKFKPPDVNTQGRNRFFWECKKNVGPLPVHG